MASLYFRRIVDGKITIEEVPERWRNKTQALLDEAGII